MQVSIREQQPHVDLRIGCQERGDDRQDMQPSEEARGRQDEFAARRMEFAGCDPFGLVDIVEDAAG